MARKKQGDSQQARFGNLTHKAIEQHVGERNYRLGLKYFDSAAVFHCRQEGDVLKAFCRGQSADHYAISVKIQGGKIKHSECSCPVGGGGQCKHLAAVLLTALHSPEEFLKADPLKKQLEKCDQATLIRLIVQMVEQEPDLESWLELALPAILPTKEVVKPDVYRRQTVAAFANAGYGWEADRQLTAALEKLAQIGDQFLEQKKFESAAAVYCGILDGFTSEYETFHDETGNVSGVANDCLGSLGTCLPEFDEGAKPRELILKTLYDAIRFDIDQGGIGIGDDVPDLLIDQTTPAEKALIASWIRNEKLDKDDVSNWRRESWGSLLLSFEGQTTDDEAYLKHCREFGLTGGLVERLLERGRLDEALKEIRSAKDYELMQHADRLIAHQHHDVALSLVQQRISSTKPGNNDWQLREWLKRYYNSQSDWPALLELCLARFRKQPSLANYLEVKQVSEKLKSWDSLRPELLLAFPRDSADLIRVYLADGEVERAIQFLKARKQRSTRNWSWDGVELEVAKAAEKSFPETALEIYAKQAERLIGGRSRGSYQQACGYLKKVQKLYKVLKREGDWTIFFRTLRDKNRNLPAFHDELRRAGL